MTKKSLMIHGTRKSIQVNIFSKATFQKINLPDNLLICEYQNVLNSVSRFQNENMPYEL